MKTLSKCLAAFLVITNSFNALAQHREINFEHGKWAEILEKSKKENKPVYLDCYAVWCGPCKWMAKNVFTNDTVADFYNAHFINVEMDMEKGEGIELAKKYGIQAYPTMLYLDSNGDIMHRACGSAPTSSFVEWGNNAITPEKQLSTFTKKFNNGNIDGATAFSYFSLLESGCQSYNSELVKYFATQKENDLTSRNNWKIIYQYTKDYSSKEFNYLEKNQAAFSKLYTKDSVQNKIKDVYTAGLYLALRKKDNAGYQMLKTKVKESGSPDAEKILLDADLKLYQRDADWNKYASTAKEFVEKYAKDNANALNSFAWTFYENVTDKTMLEEAAKWAKHSTELDNGYANNDTYAAVLYKLGKKADAKKAAENAIELAKKSGDNYTETEELLKKINKLN